MHFITLSYHASFYVLLRFKIQTGRNIYETTLFPYAIVLPLFVQHERSNVQKGSCAMWTQTVYPISISLVLIRLQLFVWRFKIFKLWNLGESGVKPHWTWQSQLLEDWRFDGFMTQINWGPVISWSTESPSLAQVNDWEGHCKDQTNQCSGVSVWEITRSCRFFSGCLANKSTGSVSSAVVQLPMRW